MLVCGDITGGKRWGALLLVGVVAGLGVGCGPVGDGTESESETETESGGSASTATVGGMDDAADTPDAGVDDDPPGDDDPPVGDDESDTAPSDESDGPGDASDTAGDDDPCPPGALDCPCDVGATCEDGLMCDVEAGNCIEPPKCNQPEGEPNETEDDAVDLGAIECGAQAESTFGALAGVDLDMFRVQGTDSFVCLSNPSVTVTADVDLRTCLYFECDAGGTNVSCPADNEDAESPAGHPGCCGLNGASLASLDCMGIGSPDNGTLYARVGQADSRMCIAYNMDYAF